MYFLKDVYDYGCIKANSFNIAITNLRTASKQILQSNISDDSIQDYYNTILILFIN